ncbi:MAG: hypothetical protein ACRDHU_04665 [Actinomycetota bacterium]
MIAARVVLDVDASVAGLLIEPGGALVFDPDRSRTLETSGNLLVEGRLVMRPARPEVDHRVVFTDVDEDGFVGGGMDPLDSDVGLWIMGSGAVSLRGTSKRAWTRAAGSVPAGETSIELEDDPAGWRVGDEIVIAPTGPPAGDGQADAYDSATVVSIDGRAIGLSEPTSVSHPEVSVGRDRTFTAEVLNLSRNVRIEGTAGGRSHVFIRSSRPQTIRNVAVRHMGPRRSDAFGDFVLGRYAIHIHECGDGSRGSRVVGVVVRDTGSHAFVAHNSHGVTFRRCVSHDTLEIPYWWDHEEASRSHDTRYEGCVASAATSDGDAGRLAGFFMGGGRRNVATGCVAVGIGGSDNSSGFFWPGARSEGVWSFEGNLAHHCQNGIFTWQNTGRLHVISEFVGYHNRGYGIVHGAHRNPYWYLDSILYGNAAGGVRLSALSRNTEAMTFGRVLFDQAGMSPHCVRTAPHARPGQAPGVFQGCEFKGYTDSAMAFESIGPAAEAELFDVSDCAFEGNEFWLDSQIHADSIIRVFDTALGTISLHRADQEGEWRPEWNARVRLLSAPGPAAGPKGARGNPA